MNPIVIDANIALALVVPLPYSEAAVQYMQRWQGEQTRILVPTLWEYEIVSGLRRACAQGILTSQQARAALDELLAMRFEVLAPDRETHQRALEWSGLLGQSKAYDAQYLAAAEQTRAELWTADRRLANAAAQAGATWVHWIGAGE